MVPLCLIKSPGVKREAIQLYLIRVQFPLGSRAAEPNESAGTTQRAGRHLPVAPKQSPWDRFGLFNTQNKSPPLSKALSFNREGNAGYSWLLQ